MKQSRRSYSREFKQEAVELSYQAGMSAAQVERDLGLPKGLLYQWRSQYQRDPHHAFPGKGKLNGEAAGIRELERELALVKQERDILRHILRLVTYNSDVIEAQYKDRVSIHWRPRILKWERRIPVL